MGTNTVIDENLHKRSCIEQLIESTYQIKSYPHQLHNTKFISS